MKPGLTALSGEIRRAVPVDADEILALLAAAFPGHNGAPPTSSRATHPYLWNADRVGNHFVFVHRGRIIGVAGLYPYDVVTCGVPFRAAGVGQVACREAYRGRGVMSALLRCVCAEADAMNLDFSWLGGDRLRYGRYGWALGGASLRVVTSVRYLPRLRPSDRVRPLDRAADFGRLKRFLRRQADAVLLSDEELRQVFESEGTGGWVLDDAFIVYRNRGDVVCYASGKPAQIARLIAFNLESLRAAVPGRREISVECAPRAVPLVRACFGCYQSIEVRPSASFRVGRLAPFLRKVCSAVQPRVNAGTDRLALVNTDTGDGATIVCRGGRLSVEDRAGRGARQLDTRMLSELCFGLLPPDIAVPQFAAASPLRQVFPFAAHVSHLFGV